MKECDLKACKTEEFSFANKINGVQRIELGHKYSYNVRYAKNNTCCGFFTAEISDKKNPESFYIKLTVSGQFVTAPGTEKEILHLKTYDALFPFVKAAVANFTANAGIPPIYIPYIDISDKNIYRVDLPNLQNGMPPQGDFSE